MKLGSAQWKNLIRDGTGAISDSRFLISDSQSDQFAAHGLELLKWNQKINLTSITDPLDVAVKHFIDSVAPGTAISEGSSLLDIGSGGGFPGIPLKILIPSLSVTLIDSSRKKTNFQKHVIRTLDLKNTDAAHVRAEELAREEAFANAFDVVISRALSSLDTFVSMALPLVAKNGIIIAMKGKISEEEIESAYSLVSKVSKTSEALSKESFFLNLKKYKLPYLGAQRSMVLIQLQTCQ